MPHAPRITAVALDAVLAHAERDRPRECCGVLVGDAACTILEAIPLRNLAVPRKQFLIDPKGHIDAIREARRRGLQIVGFYHSHPESAAYPSERDARGTGGYQALHLIVGREEGAMRARLFQVTGETFREEVLEVLPGADAPPPVSPERQA